MPFDWSLNPYTGCAHRCTFCYVRAFEARADRPSDDRYGRSIRVKVNVAEVLRRELARPSWKRESVAIGAATDPYQPAEGRYRLTRACIRELGAARTPFSLDHARADDPARHRRPRRRGPPGEGARELLGADARRADLARDRAGHGAAAPAARDGADPCRGGNRHGRRARAAPARAVRRSRAPRRGRARGAGGGRDRDLGERPLPRPGTREHFLEALARDWPELLPEYERLYAGRSYLSSSETEPVRRAVRELARGSWQPRRPTIEPEPEPKQLALAVLTRGRRPAALVESHCVAEDGEITVLIADDHEVVREGLRLALLRSPHIRVVGEAPDGETAVALAERRKPNVVIMDLRMPQMDGIEATEEIVPAPRTRASSCSPPTASGRCSNAGSSRARTATSQGGAARDPPQGDREGRRRRDLRRPRADPLARDGPRRTGDPHPARARDPAAPRRRHVERRRRTAALHLAGDREEPRAPHPREARGGDPHPGGRHRAARGDDRLGP